jgi:hypothetical protein
MGISRRGAILFFGLATGGALSEKQIQAQVPNGGPSPAPTPAPPPAPTPPSTPAPNPASNQGSTPPLPVQPVQDAINNLNASANANTQYMRNIGTTSQATISVQYGPAIPYVPQETPDNDLDGLQPEDDPLNFEDKDAMSGMYPQLFD